MHTLHTYFSILKMKGNAPNLSDIDPEKGEDKLNFNQG